MRACKGFGGGAVQTVARPTVASAREDDYDVHYLKFDLVVSHTEAKIDGSVSTTATVVAPEMQQYVFELDDTLTIDSVIVNGTKLPYTTSGQVRTVALPASLSQGATFTARVYYRGWARGAERVNDPGMHNADSVTFTSIEPYFAHIWWPCKQSLLDKIDSVDMWVTVPHIAKAGSNGVLQRITSLGPQSDRYEWKTRYPMDYYLISISVGYYDEYTYNMHFDGSTDSMPIMNYVHRNAPKNVTTLKPWLDSTALIVNYFSSLFGRYPFWKEKYGHCYTPASVNMEHQTMTSTKFSSLTVIAHELAHQWFGDYVTCGTWKDIWLNESFATYAQYLCYDHFDGHDKAYDYMRTRQDDATSQDWGSVYCNDTTFYPRIFDGRITYHKGACVIHMLRHEINNDEKFFAMLRDHLQQHAFGNATTEDFRKTAERYAGKPLDAFFEQWIYKEGFPFINVTWNQVNDAVFLRIDQTTSAPWSQFTFTMPLEISLFSPQGDTTVTVNMSQPSEVFTILWNKPVNVIDVDRSRWMLFRKAKDPERDNKLDPLPVTASVYPVPAHDQLHIAYQGMKEGGFALYDAAGRQVLAQKLQWDAGIELVDIAALPKGIYLYRISDQGRSKVEGKIRKD